MTLVDNLLHRKPHGVTAPAASSDATSTAPAAAATSVTPAANGSTSSTTTTKSAAANDAAARAHAAALSFKKKVPRNKVGGRAPRVPATLVDLRLARVPVLDEAKRILRDATGAVERLDEDIQASPNDRSSRSRRKRERLRDKVASQLVKSWVILEDKLRNPHVTRKRDKIAFFFGATDLWLTAALLGLYPRSVPVWYTIKAVILLGIRWGSYRRKRWHYFLADFCYLINSMLLVFLLVMPSSTTLFNVLFACAHGPLAWAIVTWRNSMVFHSLDKMTSVFIHLSPPVTLMALRWLDTTASTAASPYYGGYPGAPQRTEPLPAMSMTEALVGSTIVYLVWQVAYYVLILHRRRDKVYKQGYATSFTWLLQDQGAIGKAMGVFGDQHRLVTFMLLQFVYSMVTVLPSYVFARSQIANMLFLAFILSASIWNGANFYINVFSKRYLTDLQKLEDEFKSKVVDLATTAPNSTVVSPVPAPVSAKDSELRQRSAAKNDQDIKMCPGLVPVPQFVKDMVDGAHAASEPHVAVASASTVPTSAPESPSKGADVPNVAS
ncbi:hypothetical protein AMAG_09822 [Allomyces macrogynus ATCC 38327]|uniref:Glycerophosphocholine acyltransferase 1 n=1 Tax=Allomyces macrogynus (strain ATCC 38327) TaxID=578462 RepID=A0A0L0SU37_ALLM3|nr:hypothetical protein AMAG_09822 [Allomyces macrogynus ATCC 38327]|eukprot:KNE65854.1 hypothetical protein AMAG_09822 [Allomyces macrogynus ATCC 38327]